MFLRHYTLRKTEENWERLTVSNVLVWKWIWSENTICIPSLTFLSLFTTTGFSWNSLSSQAQTIWQFLKKSINAHLINVYNSQLMVFALNNLNEYGDSVESRATFLHAMQIQQNKIWRYIYVPYMLRCSFETWVGKGKKYNLSTEEETW